MNEAPGSRDEAPVEAAIDELPALTDHGCFLFFPIRVPDRSVLREAELTLQGCLRRAPASPASEPKHDALRWLQAAEREILLASDRATHLWEPMPMELGSDLHPHIARMLGRTGHDARADALTFRLADLPLRLLQGKTLGRAAVDHDARGRCALVMELNAAAQTRLSIRLGAAAPAHLSLRIVQIRLVIFRTRVGVVVVEALSANRDDTPLHPYALVEAVNSLSRFNTLRWHPPAQDSNGKLPDAARFSLADIVSSLHASADIGGRGRRVFSATYAQFADAPQAAARRRYSIQLARHYSDHYRVSPALGGMRFVADFESVTHAMSMEGCATVVDLTPPPNLGAGDFLLNFKPATFERHYLPVMVLAFHEFTTLLHLTNDCKFWAAGDGDDAFERWRETVERRDARVQQGNRFDRSGAFARLERLRDDVLRFRLCYGFSHVSFLSMHNAVYEAMREVWGSERMLDALSRDTAEITAFLEQMIARKTARQVRIFGVIGAAGLAFLSAYALADKLAAALGASPGTLRELAPVVFGVVIGLGGAIVAWIKTRHPSGEVKEEGLAEEAAREEVLAALAEK